MEVSNQKLFEEKSKGAFRVQTPLLGCVSTARQGVSFGKLPCTGFVPVVPLQDCPVLTTEGKASPGHLGCEFGTAGEQKQRDEGVRRSSGSLGNRLLSGQLRARRCRARGGRGSLRAGGHSLEAGILQILLMTRTQPSSRFLPQSRGSIFLLRPGLFWTVELPLPSPCASAEPSRKAASDADQPG